MRPRGPNPQPGTKPENFVSSNGVRMGRGAADDRDRMDRQGQGIHLPSVCHTLITLVMYLL